MLAAYREDGEWFRCHPVIALRVVLGIVARKLGTLEEQESLTNSHSLSQPPMFSTCSQPKLLIPNGADGQD